MNKNEKEGAEFGKLYSTWTDEALVEALTADRAQYRPEALVIMEQELRKRNKPVPEVTSSASTGSLLSGDEEGRTSVGERMANMVRGFKPAGIAAASGGAILRRAWGAFALLAIALGPVIMFFASLFSARSLASHMAFWFIIIPYVAVSLYIVVMMVVGTWKLAKRIPFLLLAIPVFGALALLQLYIMAIFVLVSIFHVGVALCG